MNGGPGGSGRMSSGSTAALGGPAARSSPSSSGGSKGERDNWAIEALEGAADWFVDTSRKLATGVAVYGKKLADEPLQTLGEGVKSYTDVFTMATPIDQYSFGLNPLTTIKNQAIDTFVDSVNSGADKAFTALESLSRGFAPVGDPILGHYDFEAAYNVAVMQDAFDASYTEWKDTGKTDDKIAAYGLDNMRKMQEMVERINKSYDLRDADPKPQRSREGRARKVGRRSYRRQGFTGRKKKNITIY